MSSPSLRGARRAIATAASLATAFGASHATTGPAQTPRAQVRLAHDRNYLYAAWTVDDTHVDAAMRGTSPATWPGIRKDDAVEVRVRAGDREAILIVNAAGAFAFLENGKPTAFFGMKFAPTVRGTLERANDADKGFDVETALPWSVLGLSAGADPESLKPEIRLTVHKRGADPTIWPSANAESWQPLAISRPDGRPVPVAPKEIRIDGTLGPDEWQDAPIQFEVPDPIPERAAPTQPVTLSPVIPTDREGPRIGPADDSLGTSRPVLARYMVGLNADLLKRTAPPRGIFSAQGGYAAIDHPMAGFGPWISSDRVGWHREQLGGMARAGVDIAWTVVGPDGGEAAPFDSKALLVLATAAKELRREGARIPKLAPALELPSDGDPIDLATESGRERLYRSIARWFATVPASQVARLRVRSESGMVGAVPVSLGPAGALRNTGSDWLPELRKRFAADFGSSLDGATIAFVGEEGCSPSAGFAAVLGAGGSNGLRADRVRPGSMSPFVPRKFGESYKVAWEAAREADWIVVDSWNDYAAATEIAPTRQYGDGFAGLTRLFKATVEPARIAAAAIALGEPDLPARLQPGQVVPLDVPVRNTTGRPFGIAEIEMSYRWIAENGSVVEGANKSRPSAPLAPGVDGLLRIGIATAGAGATPLAAGPYRLEILLTHPGGTRTLVRPVVVSNRPSVEFDSTTAPAVARSGAEIPVSVRLRLAASEGIAAGKARIVWQILDGSAVVAAGQQTVDRAIQTGNWVSFPLLVRVAGLFGEPLPPAYPERKAEGETNPSKWGYRIRWALLDPEGEAIDGGLEEAFAVYPPGDSARIEALPDPKAKPISADSLVPVRVRVTNTGSERWAKGQVALTGRWFQADGFPMALVAALPTLPLPADVAVGESVELEVPVRTPLRMGRYVVGIFATRPPDGFFALSPVTGAADTAFVRMDVVGGKTIPVDLSGAFDTDAVAAEPQPRDGDLDGSGATLPAEWFASDSHGLGMDAVALPSGYYTDITSDIVRSAIFAYGSAKPGARNAVAARGQTVPVPAGRAIAVHVAATTTGASPAELTLILRHRDGKHETVKRTLKSWRDSPQSGEALALRVPRVRTPGGDLPVPAALQHVIVPVAPGSELVGIVLPNNPEIKVFALTLER